MDRKIALPIGFAVMVLLAVVGVLSLLSFTAAQPTEASILDASNFTLGEIDTETFNPIVATAPVTGVSSSNTPITPGVASSYTIKFITPNLLQNGSDEIILKFEDDFGVPSLIDPSQVTISANTVVGGTNGSAGEAVKPEGVTIEIVGSEKDEEEVRLRVPDMDTSDNTGGQSIPAGAEVTVVVRQGAGITNGTEGTKGAGGYDINVRVTNGGLDNNTNFKFEFPVPVRIDMSSDGDARGDDLTLLARGIEGKESATFWLDLDGDGIRDQSERDLCTVLADKDDTATCEVIVSNPPFVPGNFSDKTKHDKLNGAVAIGAASVIVDDGKKFQAGQKIILNAAETVTIASIAVNVLTLTAVTTDTHADNSDITLVGSCTAGSMANCNFINVLDSESRTTTSSDGTSTTPDQAAINDQNFELQPSATGSPNEGNVGDTITISVFDMPGTQALTGIKIGKKAVPFPAGVITGASGEASFAFTIPGTDLLGNRVPTGKRRVDVEFGAFDQDFNLTISGANLSLSHDTVVANQDLTITGSGFSEGTNLCILQGDITINNVAVQIDDTSDCPIGVGVGILLTSGGTFTITVRVHDVVGSSPALSTALLTEGTVELKVIDSAGSEGSLQVAIAERGLDVTPAAARPRDIITIIGRAFIADNGDGLSTTVDVVYTCGTNTRTVTADPDVSGNFRETLRIPSNCAIPSTNTITAKIRAAGQATGVVETVTHEIPEGLISIEPGRGASGTLVTVSGVGFRSFETVNKIEFGGLGTIGGRTVNTDANGDFIVDDVLVPGLDPGIHAVKVEVSTGPNRTSASTSFEVLESGLFGVPTAMEDVYAMSDSILRVFWFDNSTKEWFFNDRSPEFADVNDLLELVSGGVYWFLVAEDVDLDVDGILLVLTCTGDDCWNLDVWP